MEYQGEEDVRCHDCGLPRDETMRDEAIDGKPNPDHIEYNALAVLCNACRATAVTARARAGMEDIDPLAGVKWRLEPEDSNGHVH